MNVRLNRKIETQIQNPVSGHEYIEQWKQKVKLC